MKDTRLLDYDEIRRVSGCFNGTYEIRNRALFMLGVSTGGRISELLSLRVGDVFQNKKPVSDLLYTKRIVKAGSTSNSAFAKLNLQMHSIVDNYCPRPISPKLNRNGMLNQNGNHPM